MDGAAGFGGEIAAAVEDQPPALRGDREEAARHPLLVEHAPAGAQVVPEIAGRRVAGRVLARVDGQHRAPVRAVEALAQSLLRFSVWDREDARWIFHRGPELRDQECLPVERRLAAADLRLRSGNGG